MTIVVESNCAEDLLLADPEDISPEWLTAMLRRSVGDSAPVAACNVVRFAEGSALLSRLYRVHLRYGTLGANGPESVVVKLATNDAEQLFAAEVLGLYRREALVYSRLAGDLPYRTPNCHLAVTSHDGRASTLVLEDLGRCATVDQVGGAPTNVVTDCIDAMAAQHARWSGARRLERLAAVLWPLTHPEYPTLLAHLFESGWDIAREVLADAIDPRLAAFGNRWPEECGDLLRRLGSEPTLLHGDWRADNLFYDGTQLIVADFQVAGIGAGAYDLAYFVSQSVAPIVRHRRQHEIVAEYVAALEAHGVQRDIRTVWDEYRIALIICLVYPVVAFRSWDSRNERGRALIEVMLTRAAEAIAQTDALDLAG